MPDSRYSEHAETRAEFTVAVSEAADKIATVLKEHSGRDAPRPYPIGTVLTALESHWSAVLDAMRAYPLAVALTPNGRPEPLGQQLAQLAGHISSAFVFYHGLDTVPDQFSGRLNTDLRDLERAAEGVVMLIKQWG